jgi:hypothetical protein
MKELLAGRPGMFFMRYFEVTVWVVALILMASMSPVDSHSGLCPFKAVGLPFCPGCGLGHSISWLFHGNLTASFSAHPLGWFAVLVLFYRIYTLVRKPVI